MRTLKRIVIALLLLGVVSAIALAWYVNRYGKDIFLAALRTSLDKTVEIQDISYKFPLSFRARNVSIRDKDALPNEDFIRAREVVIDFDLKDILKKRLKVSVLLIIEPIIIVKKTPQVSIPENKPKPSAPGDASPANEEKKESLQVHFADVIVVNGQIDYSNISLVNPMAADNVVSKTIQDNVSKFSFRLEHVQLKIKNLILPPKPIQTGFEFSGVLAQDTTPLASSRVNGKGWVNWPKRDMKAQFHFTNKDGKTGIVAKGISENNKLRVDGSVNAKDLQLGQGESADIEESVLGALSTMGFQVAANFSFETKMDNFKVEAIQFSGTVKSQ